MDYSELVQAIKKKDMRTANRLLSEATPILVRYLVSNLDAGVEDAKDAVQQMFEYLIPKIQNGEINSPSGLLSYMLTGARHSYYKIYRDYRLDKFEDIREDLVAEPEQAWKLVNEDKESVLLRCLEKMKDHYRDMVTFLFDHPNADSEDLAEYFGISLSNAWIRKHRAIQQLSECIKKYF